MGSKTAIDIDGFEYDWLAIDGEGHVALFSTAGAGYAPPQLLADTDAHYSAIRALIALGPSTSARVAPKFPPDVENTWLLVAERGLFAYDCTPNGGPYRILAIPTQPARIQELPASVASVAGAVRLNQLRFAAETVISREMLQRLG